MSNLDVTRAGSRDSEIPLHGPEAFAGMRKAGQLAAAALDMPFFLQMVGAEQELAGFLRLRLPSPDVEVACEELEGRGHILGREFPFKVVHILELLDQLRSEGKLKTSGSYDERLTYHDPCNISRRGGVLEQPRPARPTAKRQSPRMRVETGR